MSDQDCRRCRDWRGCFGKDSYSYTDIRFCNLQMIWLINNLEILESGNWPREADDNKSSHQVINEATFTRAVEMSAETKERLDSLPRYVRDHLLDVIQAEIEIENMSYIPRKALYYISGRRKDMPFSKWLWQQNKRREKSNARC